MFDKNNNRYVIILIWLLAFAGLWLLFDKSFPINTLRSQLDSIEESVEKKQWKDAKKYTAELKENFVENRMYIEMNNATEAFTTFEHTIGQLEITVKHEQESAIEYIGALREAVNLVIKPFSGP